MRRAVTVHYYFSVIIFLAHLRVSAARDDAKIKYFRPHQPKLRSRGLWRQPRIVGGQSATAGSFPYFVQLPNGCGGTLIHDDLVLSAAHCVAGNSNAAALRASPTVYVGGVDTKQGQERNIREFRVDPRYQPHTGSYDFAFILLDKPVENATPALINSEPTYPMNGAPLAVVGFGHTNDGAKQGSSTLEHAVVNYRADCSSTAYSPGRVRDYEMMCANVHDYSKDACQGDSGGPLIDENNILVGVISWGDGCAQQDAPGVYARVSAASEWIEQQKCEMSNVPPAHCTCTKFSPNCVAVRLDVHYDSYPSETGWKLVRHSDRSALVNMPIGSITGLHLAVVSYPVLVPVGAYDIEVVDSYGDGMCCNYGSGFVNVFNGSQEIQHAGTFGDHAVIPFTVMAGMGKPGTTGSDPVLAPSAAPTAAPVTVRVEIVYDWYPEETSWTFVEDASGGTLHTSDTYSVLTPMQSVITDIPGLLPGHVYTLSIMDLARDGLCCTYGEGSARMVMLKQDGSEGATLWAHDGRFGIEVRASVAIP